MTLTVTLDADHDTPAMHAVLASLPQWLRATSDNPDIRTVAGNNPDWPERLRAAITSAPRAVLLTEPAPADAQVVSELADMAQVPVVIATPWALNPAALSAADRVRAAVSGAALVELFAARDVPPATSLLAQLGLVRVAAGEISMLHVARLDERGYTATARIAGVPAQLTGVRTTAGTDVRMILRGLAEEWQLRFGDPALALPASVTRIDDSGETLLPTHYETAQRAAWRAVHAAAVEGVHPRYTLRDLAADLTLLD
ncbi:hypothetical protein JOF56_008659 [Kibdelosporangium banguiense]|uniref:Uncharacterized protein n=1 Tax=Kibdelosporangium banguiense TaxID=1365924 RepID=A0ABS4TV49_9PSEU|nr:hypothetical protein [Kibdelosporangium banguiense]MBP2328274.1 hypothetical protein [Kibdelosporangium banguiense]